MGGALAAILTRRWVRTSMLEELSQDYIRTAHGKRFPKHTVVYRHALRNAMIPVLTVLGLQFGALLAGAIVTEKIFSWPGIGRLTIDAISNRDYYVVQGCILAIGLTYVAVNLLTDILPLLSRKSENSPVMQCDNKWYDVTARSFNPIASMIPSTTSRIASPTKPPSDHDPLLIPVVTQQSERGVKFPPRIAIARRPTPTLPLLPMRGVVIVTQ